MSQLPPAAWREAPGLKRIVAALLIDGGAVRYVGGAVRDTLLNLEVTDVDLATPLTPVQVAERLDAAAIKVVPTGIAHGTVTAVVDGDRHEITTLRRDVATDGRRATIAFADDWQEDAARRDFTINALYADPATGEISDWFGGLDDLKAGRVTFIGDAATRIAEDHLRILRFYRFAARFGKGPLDPVSHAAVIAARASLKSLSRERVADELLKILGLADPRAIVAQMAADGIFATMLPECDPEFSRAIDRLVRNETAIESLPSSLRRLAALLGGGKDAAAQVAHRLRLSNRQRKHLVLLADQADAASRPVRQLAYDYGEDAARDIYLLYGDVASTTKAAEQLLDWEPPVLPLKGGDIVARGIAAGPEVARLLKAVEAAWVREDFPDGERVAALLNQNIGSSHAPRQ